MNKIKEYITENDIRFWCFLMGFVGTIIIWGVRLEGKASANEFDIKTNKEERILQLIKIESKLDLLLIDSQDRAIQLAEIKKDIEYIKKKID